MEANNSADTSPRPKMRRGLGRGLNALLGGADPEPTPPSGDRTQTPSSGQTPADDQIAVGLIAPNPFQPREDFDPETMRELVKSVKKQGVLLPLLVRPQGEQYQLVAGERRLRAAKEAGLETVPCRVLQLDDRQVCEAAIEENLKRKDLNVLEKARAFQAYLQRFESTVEQLARQLSLSRSTVSNMIRLLDLSEPVQQALRADQISAGHARALLALEPAQQEQLCATIQSEKLSVRDTERTVREWLAASEPIRIAEETRDASQESSTAPALSKHVLSLQDQLRELLGVKVEIKLQAEDRGRIMIDFYSNDDFTRIVRFLRRAA